MVHWRHNMALCLACLQDVQLFHCLSCLRVLMQAAAFYCSCLWSEVTVCLTLEERGPSR